MDGCFIDVTVEFLSVAFHNILYHIDVYPKSIFETRKKYSLVVYQSIHPEVNEYIDCCLKAVEECLKTGKLNRVDFAITNSSYEPIAKFVFEIFTNDHFDDTEDAYLVRTEQNLRAFCLNLPTISHKLQNIPKDCSFSIFLHTNESTAVSLSTNPELETFPLVETNDKSTALAEIVPLKRILIKQYIMETYIEVKEVLSLRTE